MAGDPERIGGVPNRPGVSLEELRALILEKTGVSVGPDDPVMAAYVLHQAFLGDYQRMLDRHTEALTVLFESAVQDWSAGVEKQVAVLSSEILSEGTKERVAQLAEYAGLARDLARRQRRALLWMSCLSLLNISAAGVSLAALFLILQ